MQACGAFRNDSSHRAIPESTAFNKLEYAAMRLRLLPIFLTLLATGTKYDAMLKLRDNAGGYAMAILLNDPNSSFFEYLGTHRAYDWQQIMGDFGAAATAFALDADLL